MLQFLKISNLALLESASIDFDEGFTVVTGETGAGKSIFLGALSLLSGARTDKSLIRAGENQCVVEASLHFEKSEEIDQELEEMDLPPCEDGELLLKRSLHTSKSSRISVNGSLATLANLQALGPNWIDFHGPGEPQRLLRNECQLEMIDLYSGLEEEASVYREQYREWKGTLSEIERLRSETQLSPDQIDFLKAQIATIDALELSEERIAELDADFNRVSSGQELHDLTNELGNGLTGDGGLVEQLGAMDRTANEAAALDPHLSEYRERLSSMILELQELGSEYEAYATGLNLDPEFAETVQAQMSDWQNLRRKYGREVKDVLAAGEEMSRKIESQGDIEGTLRSLHERADEREQSLKRRAKELSAKRLAAGRKLAKQTEKELLELGFKKGRCAVEMVSESGLKSYGDSLPQFAFSPNVGEPLKPLAKVASSGELARVMLALKTILADVDSTPVLVFDEVDANVGGEIGKFVGEKMRAIGKGHQVFCITHLPQVAALGRNHFLVDKDQSGNRAQVSISKLQSGGDDRLSELARMLGDRKAQSALTHAKELLAEA